MGVETADTIDLIGVDNQTGRVVLTITDHLPWDSDEHLAVLQDKLNAYLRFVESGELLQKYSDARGRKPEISIVFKHPPTAVAKDFLGKVSRILDGAGVAFRHETLAH